MIAGVDILGAAKGMGDAGELAGSPRYNEALDELRKRYDYVIIDCPPVNQVSESVLIARRADAALLLLRQGESRRTFAVGARRRLA